MEPIFLSWTLQLPQLWEISFRCLSHTVNQWFGFSFQKGANLRYQESLQLEVANGNTALKRSWCNSPLLVSPGSSNALEKGNSVLRIRGWPQKHSRLHLWQYYMSPRLSLDESMERRKETVRLMPLSMYLMFICTQIYPKLVRSLMLFYFPVILKGGRVPKPQHLA